MKSCLELNCENYPVEDSEYCDQHRRLVMFDEDKLYCYGCCHSASNAEFPGRPSGERPCCFCLRNKELMKKFRQGEKAILTYWYGNTVEARSVPMDCYHPLDMMDTFYDWLKEEKKAGMALYRYLKECYDVNIIDHSIRSTVNPETGSVEFYIHAEGKDSDTVDFIIDSSGGLTIDKGAPPPE